MLADSSDGVADPEHDERLLHPRAHDRDVAAVIARRLVLFVRAVVLLVDDDQADVLERREDRRPRADDDVDLAAPDAVPLDRAARRPRARCAESRRATEPRAKAPATAGVRPISGTSTSTRRPASTTDRWRGADRSPSCRCR